jgi:hypothetical protein
VAAPKIGVPGGKELILVGADGIADFPKRLDDGESGSLRIGYREIAHSLAENGLRGKVRIHPHCSIETGERFRGKHWDFDISDVLSSE